MATKSNVLKCIHGIYYKSCAHCQTRAKKEVIDELKEAEEREGIVFDYIEVGEVETAEVDTDYDIEVDS